MLDLESCWYTLDRHTLLIIDLTDQPLAMSSEASSSSSSGWVGRIPRTPKSSVVGTIPRPIK